MFVTKQEIIAELKGTNCWKSLSANEKSFFLEYVSNGHNEVQAYKDVYIDDEETRVTKFIGKKAATIMAKPEFAECFEIYAEVLRNTVSMRANAHLFNYYYVLATYNILDFVDEYGAFKFLSIEDAKEQLGLKAIAITGIDTVMHPKDPTKTMTTVKFYDRGKALKELSKYTQFYGTGETDKGLSNISINSQVVTHSVEEDEFNRMRLGIAK